MKRVSFSLVSCFTVLAGCMTMPERPAFSQAAITPNQLAPGGTASVTAHIQDAFDIVARVDGIIEQDPTVVFRLRDDGVEPDTTAADGIWTLQVDVPFNAPLGEFAMSLTAYDTRGRVISIRDQFDEEIPLGQTIHLSIRNAE